MRDDKSNDKQHKTAPFATDKKTSRNDSKIENVDTS